jgi:HAT1-interacting factor 1
MFSPVLQISGSHRWEICRDTVIADASPESTLETAIEHGKRAFALGKYEQAVDFYATALEFVYVASPSLLRPLTHRRTKKFGDDAPETADLYFSYGKALLENAISNSGVLGKDQPEEGDEDEPVGLCLCHSYRFFESYRDCAAASGNGPILSFSGDAEDTEDDPAVDLFSAAQNMEDADEAAAEEGEDGDDAEPEDDFNAAWEVLDLARAIYAKQSEEAADDEDVRLKLADTYVALGDVSLETGADLSLFTAIELILFAEKFDQAITDYEAGLTLKAKLLPLSSRQIAEAHYKLSMVLDLTSGRLGDAISHAERAVESIESRLAELANPPAPTPAPAADSAPAPDPKGKGKGKATGTRLVGDDLVSDMSAAQIEAETKELLGLKEDLALKVHFIYLFPPSI